MKNKIENKTIKLSFAANSYPYIENNIIKPIEKEIRGKDMISFGENNDYPNYLYSLFNDTATLKSVINGTVDYVCGDEIKSNVTSMSDAEMSEFIRQLAFDIVVYGGAAVNVLRNRIGGIAQAINIDYRNIRSDKENTKFYYCEDFGKKYARTDKCTVYPKFDKDATNVPSSILYFKTTKFTTYPTPLWSAATIAAEIDKKINEYHLNSIDNGFAASAIINLCNGIPDDETKKDIEEAFNEKFTGSANAGRVIINYAPDKEHLATIEQFQTDDFDKKYEALSKRVKQEIFTAFRCTPTLCGIPTENNGFSEERYDEQFKIFNRTMVKPIQLKCKAIVEKIFGENAVEITPFTLEGVDKTVE